MIAGVVLTVCLLAMPVALPTLLLVGCSLDTLFLLPLAGALVAALSAILELAVAGSMLIWYIALCASANIVALTVIIRRRWSLLGRGGLRSVLAVSSVVQFLVVALAVAWPLQALVARSLGYDTDAVWLVRAIEVYSGHGPLFSAIHAPSSITANADYPPLLPASTAAGFFVRGHIVYDMGVALPGVLNACAMAVLTFGLVRVARLRASAGAWPGLVLGAALSLVGFGLAGSYAVNGYADLLWSASAVAAVVYGLVLPSTSRNLAVAWVCATVGALTKNEGLAMSFVILGLSSVRFVPSTERSEGRLDAASLQRIGVAWLQRAGLAVVLVLPALTWAVLVRAYGVQDSFFASGLRLSSRGRLGPTASAMWGQLHVLPFVALVALTGVLALRGRRRRVGLGNEAWLWACVLASLVLTASTYVFGDLSLGWWLTTSVDRSTLFAALLLYTDVAIWMCIAGGELAEWRLARVAETPLPVSSPDDAAHLLQLAAPFWR
jgi:hypothetical protein